MAADEKIVLFTGGFDPIHSGHIYCINESAKLGRVIIGLNSDAWLTRKKGRPFMPVAERRAVIEQFRCVDQVIEFDDSDGSAVDAILQVLAMYPEQTIVFVNGGDRTAKNIPEMDRFQDDKRVEFLFGVGGGNKSNSSSWILNEWKSPKTLRPWGYYQVLHEAPGVKVKELTVDPGRSLSMQRHQDRAEFWLVVSGIASVYSLDRSTDADLRGRYERHQYLHIDHKEWHQLINEDDEPLKIVEIQYGDRCVEEDIERK